MYMNGHGCAGNMDTKSEFHIVFMCHKTLSFDFFQERKSVRTIASSHAVQTQAEDWIWPIGVVRQPYFRLTTALYTIERINFFFFFFFGIAVATYCLYFLIEIWFIYDSIVVSGAPHSDLIITYALLNAQLDKCSYHLSTQR